MNVTWDAEKPEGFCPKCGEQTLLVIAKVWDFGEESPNEPDGLDITDDEVTGHYCNTCMRLTSLSLNTRD